MVRIVCVCKFKARLERENFNKRNVHPSVPDAQPRTAPNSWLFRPESHSKVHTPALPTMFHDLLAMNCRVQSTAFEIMLHGLVEVPVRGRIVSFIRRFVARRLADLVDLV